MGSDPSEQVPNERLMPLGCSKLGRQFRSSVWGILLIRILRYDLKPSTSELNSCSIPDEYLSEGLAQRSKKAPKKSMFSELFLLVPVTIPHPPIVFLLDHWLPTLLLWNNWVLLSCFHPPTHNPHSNTHQIPPSFLHKLWHNYLLEYFNPQPDADHLVLDQWSCSLA